MASSNFGCSATASRLFRVATPSRVSTGFSQKVDTDGRGHHARRAPRSCPCPHAFFLLPPVRGGTGNLPLPLPLCVLALTGAATAPAAHCVLPSSSALPVSSPPLHRAPWKRARSAATQYASSRSRYASSRLSTPSKSRPLPNPSHLVPHGHTPAASSSPFHTDPMSPPPLPLNKTPTAAGGSWGNAEEGGSGEIKEVGERGCRGRRRLEVEGRR